MRNHFFQRVRDSSHGRETAAFLETPDGCGLSYTNMEALTARYASALVKLGVKPGDRVAAQVEKSPEALMLYLGTLRAGAIFLPLNTAYTSAELDYFLADAEPKILVCDPTRRDSLAPATAQACVQSLETLAADGTGSLPELCAACGADFSDIPRGADDLAAILYTSGTTGRSKGAMLTHGNLASNAAALATLWRFSPADVLLHALPIYHTHGLFVAVNTVLFSGGKILFMPKFDPSLCLALMPRATAMMGVPTFYTRLLSDNNLSRETTAHMRLFVSGSAPLLEETHRAWLERTGHAILERYGMTETNMITSNPYDGERRAGTVGFPLPDVALRIADPESGHVLDGGQTGVLEVKGPNVFKGYWHNPEKTAQEFRSDGFFITGDLGRIDAEGYVQIVGRAKDLIISGGFNIYPKEVESEIDALAGVIESAVVGLPHEDFGEAVAAFVVLHPGASLDEPMVRDALAKRLAKFKLPKRVVFVEELPRNAMGKVQKNVLRETYGSLHPS
ncbi:malonyl-CoA synthase [Methylocapsa sp. D3K7]|uniref:malonate--CoA ligase n=1 Tax=Methylocapsa sp. D3K7 TaxID=3041435 RepID=UPI00244F0227|nr:malonyl-CoA synthase [Methylocapsa sp. D3K7]WGJ14850.1 malonyl-CoA synthase [Methylocapsa sp. D3K7]